MSGEDPVATTAAPDEAEADSGRSDDAETLPDRDTLAGRIAVLEAENERLREEYARAKSSRYRQTALGLAGVGALAMVAGLLFAPARTVLLALGGTGVFLGVLTYFIAPEQFIPASVGREVYGSLAASLEAAVAELGLSDDRVYVPAGEASGGGTRLYVPQEAGAPVPDDEALSEAFVVGDGARGLAVSPTGAALFEEFERSIAGDPASDPEDLVGQVADALVDGFELAAGVETDVEPGSDAAAGRLTVGVTGSSYGSVDRFDHPVASLSAVALASALDVPVGVSVDPAPNDRADVLVACRWPYPDGPETGGDDAVEAGE